ncbi:MAG: nucleoside deaminase [Candidatus Gastranaerophilales bacterium]
MKNNFMKFAIEVAKNSQGEIPVGAVITKNNEIIVSSFNKKESQLDVTAHAEILAIREAEKTLKNWRLEGCEMYVTLEPCPMCAWAIIQARLDKVYFGSYDTNYGALGSKIDLREHANSKLKVFGGIMEEENNKIIQNYFKALR